jgi:hypothetical protein
LPAVVQKFSALEDKTDRVLNDVGEVTRKVKENPSLLLRRPKEAKEPPPTEEKPKRTPKAP